MTTFVHISDERTGRSIERNGLRLPRTRQGFVETATLKHGVFAMPVISNFMITHQWVRELKRRGYRTSVGVYFVVSDDEQVWIGRYNTPKRLVTAAHAARTLRETEELGFEAIIPRSIRSSEIKYVRYISQDVGWRYSPDSKGRTPCGCPYCIKGDIKSRRIRERYEANNP